MSEKDKSIKHIEDVKNRNVDDNLKKKLDEKLKYINKPLKK